MHSLEKTRMISVDQLCVGLYVYLDMSWMDHSFRRNSFKIKDAEEIAEIRRLGLKTIRVNPRLCDGPPLAPVAAAAAAAAAEAEAAKPQDTDKKDLLVKKKALINRLSDTQLALAQCERQFVKSIGTVKNLSKNIFARPQEAYADAGVLVDQMLETLLTDATIATHLMSDRIGGEDMYLHSLNVTVLAMMLGKKMELTPDELRMLGTGCLFHDIGKLDIAEGITGKLDTLNKHEKSALQMHCELGIKQAFKCGMPKDAMEIILQHHEAFDGSGYPQKLAGEAISKLARIVYVVNTYDNLCNPVNANNAVTPFEALSVMFKQLRKSFDPAAFNMFIRCMGVYPPGTLVKLSDGTVGMVVEVNSSSPLRPGVLIHDPGVPKSEAIVLDLEKETDVNIASSITASQLSEEAYDYLSPKKRQVYFSYATPNKPGS
jgi:putative nucleotidyltransferase with HDIG domain